MKTFARIAAISLGITRGLMIRGKNRKGGKTDD
jgi:hypothetical protein